MRNALLAILMAAFAMTNNIAVTKLVFTAKTPNLVLDNIFQSFHSQPVALKQVLLTLLNEGLNRDLRVFRFIPFYDDLRYRLFFGFVGSVGISIRNCWRRSG